MSRDKETDSNVGCIGGRHFGGCVGGVPRAV